MKKYPNPVIKGLLTALMFMMLIVTAFGFIVTAAALSGEVYTTDKAQLRTDITENLADWMQRHLPAVPSSTLIRLLVFALDVVYALRYAAPVITVAGFLLTVLLFCLLMRAAGHRNGAQEITYGKFDRLPFEIAAFLMIGIPVGIHLTLYAFTRGTLFDSWYFNTDQVEIPMFILLLSPFVYALCHTFAVRLKARMFWKTTLVYRIFWKLPARLIRSVKNAGKTDENGNVVPQWYDKVPLEIAAAVLLVLPFPLMVFLHDVLFRDIRNNYHFYQIQVNQRSASVPLGYYLYELLSAVSWLIVPLMLVGYLYLVYLLAYTVSVRLKCGTLWTNTLTYRFWKWLKKMFRHLNHAGRRNEAGELIPTWFDKIPLEIVLLAAFLLGLLMIYICDMLLDFIYSDLFAFVYLILCGAAMLYGLAYVVSVRIQLGTLWTNILVYRFWKWLKKMFRHLNHAGHRNEAGELVPQWYDRIPLEIVLLAVFLLGLLTLYVTDYLENYFWNDFISPLILLIYGAAILYGLVYLISVRLQLGTLWTNTLVYRISRKCSGLYPRICRSLPLMWRTVLAVVLYCIFTFLIFAFFVDPWEIVPALLIWFSLTWAAGALLIYSSWATHTVTQVIRDMADGNIHKKTDPSKLFFVFRKQAEGLNSLGDGLQAAVEAQMKSERLKTELITNVSHDIKTPLTSIINYSDLLLAELGREIQPDGKAAEYANTIYRHSLRLKKLTEDLVEASKASSGAITVNFERIELNQMLRQAVGEYAERLTAAGLTPVFRFTEEDVFISADGRLLWRVFDNLLSNIVKYSMDGTRVYITLTQTGDRAIVSFKNISRDTLDIDPSELMERFVRGDASRHSEGSGLGLNIALSLCDRMNGRLELACDGDLFRADVEFPVI